MKENLNVGTRINGTEDMTDNGVIEKYCYYNDPTNCEKYGGLYQWSEMMGYVNIPGAKGICPDGWHIPSDEEWKILEGNVDSQYGLGNADWDKIGKRGFDVGIKLKNESGWSGSGNGTDEPGFSAMPGGNSNSEGNFYTGGVYSNFWSESHSISDSL